MESVAEITMNAKQIQNLGLWSKVCEYKGWEYLSADRVDDNEQITFDDKFEKHEKKIKDKQIIIDGKVRERELEYTPYGDVFFGDNECLSEKLLKYKDKSVRVTIEFIE